MTDLKDSVKTSNAKAPMSPDYDVLIVGAGPYGLSAAAHLKAAGMGFRIFGEPMQFWAANMPAGMLLRSPREASTIADPNNAFTLEAYEAENGVKPVAPLPLETFVNYGLWFQSKLGSALERTVVSKVSRQGSTFKVDLENGSSLTSRRVVVAAGIGPFRRIPQVFSHLPPEQLSHCYQGTSITGLSGKRVAVIGSGQSALETGALLHEGGAQVELIVRRPILRWIGMHGWLHRLGPFSKMMYSKHDVGPLGISRLIAYPNLLSHVPIALRDKIRTRAVRPAGSNWLPARLASVKTSTGVTVQSAKMIGDEIELTLSDGTQRRVDHVLLGTGYQVDISMYKFLAPDLLSEIRQLEGYPDLGNGLQSSVPGLHFVGAPAARNFGPLPYFVTGTEFFCGHLSNYISRNRRAVSN